MQWNLPPLQLSNKIDVKVISKILKGLIHYFPLQNWSKAFHLASCNHREREKGEGEKELKGGKK